METNTITEWSTAIMSSLAAAMALFFSAIPKILGFLVIVLAGWFIASLVEKGIAAILRSIRFNDLAQRSGLADFVHKMGTGTDPAGMIGAVVKWFIRLIALVVAFDALGLPAVSDVLRQLLLWLPNVVVALVVLVIGGLAARALSNIVRGAAAEGGLGNPDFLAKVASTVVWTFAVVVAVNQLGIATTLVNTLFMAVVGAIALALGLSFGLGGRETAAEIVRNWYGKSHEKAAQLQRTAEAAGQRASGMAAGGGAGAGYAGGSGSMGGSTGTGGTSGGGMGRPGYQPARPGRDNG
ncbi:mechanosensitive ion channel family protein [Ramlibacter tataouinensis]|uniref:Small-conductance mechanosensitive channel n=1 Tax=Ramlibacter tataouinensis (strain ATCC BAA-407 / DSM 14655 / LMG 21543 / TTB310) TaxID=365046 RepID=F5Y4T5_RAMTT|nr:small-conductance mechanosensitive ion channel [Ramlibacter tataouinensis]AEG92591.1 small-conductance mechanosensitive ion channel-like protein [Ramlibacter tataouinensis TTB310]